MLITEIFESLQGEGPLTGIPMLFVRTNLCNLRCKWCDTTYSFADGKEMNLEELINIGKNFWGDWICLTGGEPLLQRDSPDFVRSMGSYGKKVLIETGGSLDISKFTEMENTIIDMDFKPPSSGETGRMLESNLKFLRDRDYVKIVIQDDEDFKFFEIFYEKYGKKIKIVVQPAWGNDPKWIAEKILKEKYEVRLMLQEHKYIWGDRRGI